MQSLGLVGLWLLLNVALCSDVQIMTIDSFDNFRASLKQYPHALVRFSTEWNYRSIITEKPFQDAATYLKTTKPQVTLIEVDCTNILSACKMQGVEAYPTLLLYTDGLFSKPYHGLYTADAIVQYINQEAILF